MGAYIDIHLDDSLTFVSSQIPPSSQNGNQITIPLGNVASGACNQFSFYAVLSCGAPLGSVACTEVHIFPDSICSPAPAGWSGALIEAEASCTGDSVHFKLTNKGNVNMPATLNYIVIEDAVLLKHGNFKLNAQGSLNLPALPANGATYHLIAEQEPAAPGHSLPLAAVEGCTTSQNNGFSTGYFNQFSQNDGDGFISDFCVVAASPFDPNDKQGFPTGYEPEHYIFPNTDIEYVIRFQNTGNAPAERVILLDTISPLLDLTTLQPGASSHPYKMEITGKGVLQFTFSNINLPSNAVSEKGSQGFVTYRIAQRRNNLPGSVIRNRAGIYFDFNKPVMTSTVFHTVHKLLFDVVIVEKAPETELSVSAYPNPFSDRLRVELKGKIAAGNECLLYNTVGELVQTVPFNHQIAWIERKDLAAGQYFFIIRNGATVVGSGKIVAY